MEWIKTERGRVRVIGQECAHRPCLHIHWSSYANESKVRKSDGAEVKTFPLVCMRNEQFGCPHPLPPPSEPHA